jgi:hypothetical protein
VPPFTAAVYPSSNSFLQQDYATRLVQEWFQEHDSEFSLLQWPDESPDLNPIVHLWEEMEQAIQTRAIQTPWTVYAPMN